MLGTRMEHHMLCMAIIDHSQGISPVLQSLDPDTRRLCCPCKAHYSTVFDAIRYVGLPWKETEASTIIKCFKNAGFLVTADGVPECPEQAEEVPELDRLSNEMYGCDL